MCADSTGSAQVIPLKMVADIKRFVAGEQPDSSQVVDIEAIKEANRAPSVPTWVFTKKANKKIQRKLEKGLKVKVTYKDIDEDRNRDDTGRLKTIDEKYVVIDIKKQGILEIPKENIIKITPKRKVGLIGGIVSGLAFGIGLVLIALVALLLLLALLVTSLFSGGRDPNTNGVEEDANTGCSWALLALFIGFIALFFAIPKSIKAPFSDEWKVEMTTEEVPEEKAKEPEKSEWEKGHEMP